MNPDAIAAIVVPLCIFGIPIVAILTNHQRKMAELIHQGSREPNVNSEIASLRQDVAKLSAVVSTLAINMDNMNDKLNRQSEMQDRLKVGE